MVEANFFPRETFLVISGEDNSYGTFLAEVILELEVE